MPTSFFFPTSTSVTGSRHREIHPPATTKGARLCRGHALVRHRAVCAGRRCYGNDFTQQYQSQDVQRHKKSDALTDRADPKHAAAVPHPVPERGQRHRFSSFISGWFNRRAAQLGGLPWPGVVALVRRLARDCTAPLPGFTAFTYINDATSVRIETTTTSADQYYTDLMNAVKAKLGDQATVAGNKLTIVLFE